MLKANSLIELNDLMKYARPGQVIQVPWQIMEAYIKEPGDDKVKFTHCGNKDQAQALANFLWNEKRRHLKDVEAINHDLVALETKWRVLPDYIVAFVKP